MSRVAAIATRSANRDSKATKETVDHVTTALVVRRNMMQKVAPIKAMIAKIMIALIANHRERSAAEVLALKVAIPAVKNEISAAIALNRAGVGEPEAMIAKSAEKIALMLEKRAAIVAMIAAIVAVIDAKRAVIAAKIAVIPAVIAEKQAAIAEMIAVIAALLAAIADMLTTIPSIGAMITVIIAVIAAREAVIVASIAAIAASERALAMMAASEISAAKIAITKRSEGDRTPHQTQTIQTTSTITTAITTSLTAITNHMLSAVNFSTGVAIIRVVLVETNYIRNRSIRNRKSIDIMPY